MLDKSIPEEYKVIPTALANSSSIVDTCIQYTDDLPNLNKAISAGISYTDNLSNLERFVYCTYLFDQLRGAAKNKDAITIRAAAEVILKYNDFCFAFASRHSLSPSILRDDEVSNFLCSIKDEPWFEDFTRNLKTSMDYYDIKWKVFLQ